MVLFSDARELMKLAILDTFTPNINVDTELRSPVTAALEFDNGNKAMTKFIAIYIHGSKLLQHSLVKQRNEKITLRDTKELYSFNCSSEMSKEVICAISQFYIN
jgi:hypothetical protein